MTPRETPSPAATPFFKLSGCGNDFIALVEPASPPRAADIRAWCRRGVSLGADGLLTIDRANASGIVQMKYWNSDGGEAALCLNGTRCAARLAFHLGWHHGRVTVLTGAGEISARELDGDEVAIVVPRPAAASAITLRTRDGEFEGFRVDVGVPHFVCFRETSIEEVPIERWAPPLRRHVDLGPEGANVDFAQLLGRRDLSIRSFERGVEAETLACGTGVLATVTAALAGGRADLPLRALTRAGFTLAVLGAVDGGGIERWELSGDARVVAAGTLLPGSVPS